MTAPSLFEQAMGADFARLAEPVRRFHRLHGRHLLHGRVQTEAPSSWPARLLGRLLGTPAAAGEGPIRFALDAGPGEERWTRFFPHGQMQSRLCLEQGRWLAEQLGPARLRFLLAVGDEGGLQMQLRQVHFCGVPCPAWLRPQVLAQESGSPGRLHFHVQARLPLVGLVAGYRGYLELEEPVAETVAGPAAVPDGRATAASREMNG